MDRPMDRQTGWFQYTLKNILFVGVYKSLKQYQLHWTLYFFRETEFDID